MNETTQSQQSTYEVAVVGAGVAGLAAAALLGRCGRRVVVIGQLDRENSAAAAVHNLPYAEGIPPAELYETMECELSRHGIVRTVDTVTSAVVEDEHRRAQLSTPTQSIRAERLLIASGIRHEVPAWVPKEAWGTSVFSCPFCHAYEHSGENFLVVGPSMPEILEFALLCPPHPRSLTVLVPSPLTAPTPLTDRLLAMQGRIVVDTVDTASVLESGEVAVATAGGDRIVAGAVVLFGTVRMRLEMARSLGLKTDRYGIPEVDEDGRSSHPLVWIAGNAAKPHFGLAEAMGSGLRAGMSIHKDLALDSTHWH